MKTYASRKEMALEAFFLNDLLNGTVSGGIDIPRNVIRVMVKNTPNKSHIDVEYTYKSGYYTDKREGESFTDSYVVDGNGSIEHVGKALFDVSKDTEPFYDLCEPYIKSFTNKWSIFWDTHKTDRKEEVLS